MFVGLAKEFREFAVKGNMIDMAVGIIIGAAFGKIVSSLVADVITPPLGIIIGGIDFSGLAITLKDATAATPAVTLRYGLFMQQLFDFLIVAFALFMLVKGINAVRRAHEQKAAETPAPLSDEIKLLGEIRDLLKSKASD